MVLNPGKCHFMSFGIKENKQFEGMRIHFYYSSHEKILDVTIDNKHFFEEHIIKQNS